MKTLRLIALLSLIGTILPFGAQAQKYDFSYSKIPQRDAIYCHNCSMEKLVWVGDNLFYGITCYTLVDEGVADEYFYPAISLIFGIFFCPDVCLSGGWRDNGIVIISCV